MTAVFANPKTNLCTKALVFYPCKQGSLVASYPRPHPAFHQLQYRPHPAFHQLQYRPHPAFHQLPYRPHPAFHQLQYRSHPAFHQLQYRPHPAFQYVLQVMESWVGPGYEASSLGLLLLTSDSITQD